VPRTATVAAVESTEMVLLERGPFLEAVTGLPASAAMADAVIDARLAGAGSGPSSGDRPALAEDEANARA
jgi:hypothetical protein